MRHALEEYIARLQVREQQRICIARNSRALNLLMLCNLRIESNIKRQRTINNNIAQLTTVCHLRDNCTLCHSRHIGIYQLHSRYASNLRTIHSKQFCCLCQILHQCKFLLEIRLWQHCNIRCKQQLWISRPLEHRNMAQSTLWREQAGLLIQDSTHILVGRNHTLHQHLCVTSNNSLNCQLNALHIALFINDCED